MNSLELLKQELASQKSAIESKGGFVSIANTNVSPSEITAGINSIPAVDFQIATATEADVLSGKTFYAGTNVLKTGSLIQESGGTGGSTNEYAQNFVDYIGYYKPRENETPLNIILPEDLTKIRSYLFFECPNSCHITLNSNLQQVGHYALANASDLHVDNIQDATSLAQIGPYAFYDVKSMDLKYLPNSIQKIENSAFYNVAFYSTGIKIPSSLTDLSSYAFACTTPAHIDSIDVSQMQVDSFNLHAFEYIYCDDDLVIPNIVTSVSSYVNYNGCFKTVTFPSTCTKINSNAFNFIASIPVEDIKTESYTFLSTTPPTITSTTFNTRLISRSTPIRFYVPDESLSAYKAANYFKNFETYIFPISQKT